MICAEDMVIDSSKGDIVGIRLKSGTSFLNTSVGKKAGRNETKNYIISVSSRSTMNKMLLYSDSRGLVTNLNLTVKSGCVSEAISAKYKVTEDA